MKKIIILALCLASVWGCSDEKLPWAVGNEFPLVEVVQDYNKDMTSSVIIGNKDKLGELCNHNDEDDIQALWNDEVKEFTIQFRVLSQQEVVISFETASASQELKDSSLSQHGVEVQDHDSHKEFIVDTHVLNQGLYQIAFNPNEYDEGTYLVKVFRKEVGERCVPFIISHD